MNMEMIQKLVVLGIVENESGEILISQRFEEILPEVHLKWDLPGGKNEIGESLEETIKREILEETGLNVEVLELLPKAVSKIWNYEKHKQHTLLFCFRCKLLGGKMHLEDGKINDLRWINQDKVKEFDFLPKSREFIDFYYSILL